MLLFIKIKRLKKWAPSDPKLESILETEIVAPDGHVDKNNKREASIMEDSEQPIHKINMLVSIVENLSHENKAIVDYSLLLLISLTVHPQVRHLY